MPTTLKLMTLNTHSLLEESTAFCLQTLTEAILQEQAEIICLQEINQEKDAPVLSMERALGCGYVPADTAMPLREGNYALMVAERLAELGYAYAWTWTYTHCGYGRFDEGVAVFSRTPIDEAITCDLSVPGANCARRLLGIRTQGRRYFSVHLGWWKDPEDPLKAMLDRMLQVTAAFDGPQFLLGDFNSPAQVRGEGYDYMLGLGWMDCYPAAELKDDGITVGGQIDGWRKGKVDPMRIDFCFATKPERVLSSRVIFNDRFYPVVSDHSGVLTTISL